MEEINIRIIAATLGIIVSLHTLSLAIYFFLRRKQKKQEYTLFACILLLLSLIIAPDFLARLGYIKISFFWKYSSIFENLNLLLFPLVHIYIQFILKQINSLNLSYLRKHFYLYIAVFIYSMGVYLNLPLPKKHLYIVSLYLYILQGAYYLFTSYSLVKSSTSKELTDKVEWGKILLFVFSSYLLVKSIPALPINFLGRLGKNICLYTTSTYVFVVFVVVYVLAIFLIDPKKIISTEEKYQNSNLSNQEEDILFNTIQEHFTHKKPFLENDFSLLSLSKDLEITSKKISQVINSKHASNFNDFVNHYRIKESAELLKNTTREELLISEIYFTVGFNSKATFNTLFKKVYGKTPSQYRKDHS